MKKEFLISSILWAGMSCQALADVTVTASKERHATCSNQAYVNTQVGIYNVVRSAADSGEGSTLYALEYQDKTRLPFCLKPMVGAFATTDEDWFAYLGFKKDFALYKGSYAGLSFSSGYYHHEDGSRDLDNALEFMSRAEFGYQFENTTRVAVSFAHISNAGLGYDNPGAEMLSLNYSYPLQSF